MSTEAKIVLTAKDSTAAAFASASRNFDSLGKQAGSLGSALTSAMSAFALPVTVGAGAAALTALTISASKAVDEFNDLKDATGASIENISALDRVARETGGNFDTVASSLIKFNKILNSTEEDGSKAAEILKRIGLNADDLKKQDPAEAMRQLAVAFAKFADDGSKGRDILELTGKSIREIAPYWKDLSEKTALVGTTTTEAAEEAEKFNKELYKFKANTEDFQRAVAGNIITGLNQVIEKFREARGAGDSFLVALWKTRNIPVSLTAPTQTGGATGSWGAPVDTRPSTGSPNKPDKAKTGGVARDPFAESKRYLDNLQRQLDKTKSLSIEELTLAEIQSGRMGKVNPALEKQLLATSRLLDLQKSEKDNLKASEDAARKAADAAEKLFSEAQKYTQQVETPVEKLARELEELGRAVENNPLISGEVAQRLSTKYWEEYTASIVDATVATKELDDFTKEAAKNIQDSIGNGLVDVMEGNYKQIGDGFVKMINRMVAEAIAADISRKLFGDLVPGGTGKGAGTSLLSSFGSMLFGSGASSGGKTTGDFSRMDRGQTASGSGSLFSSLGSWFSSLLSFDVGTNYVPYDMVAKIHKGERIVPAAQNNGAGGGNAVTVNVNQSFAPGTSRATTTQAAAEASRQLSVAGRNL